MKLPKEQIFGLYLGQKILVNDKSANITFTKRLDSIIKTYTPKAKSHYLVGEYCEKYNMTDKHRIADCKLILRTYEDMTEEETEMFIALQLEDNASYSSPKGITWKVVEYLISIGIDVFGAIEQGYAVRKS